MIVLGIHLFGTGSKTTYISSLTTWLFIYRPLQSTFYIRFWALQTLGTGLSGRLMVLATPTASFGSRLPLPLTKIQKNHKLYSPSIGVRRLQFRIRTCYSYLMPKT